MTDRNTLLGTLRATTTGRSAGLSVFLTLVMVLAPMVGGIVPFATGSAAAATGPHPNVAFYDDWEMDLDGNGIDDKLDALIAAGADETVFVYLHFAREPTQADADALKDAFGVQR
ncbi:MAG: hypothetical protein R3185_06995, partial [Candidatus Thermoplasmatota archaeon]|nr:hypothetical protein [Candidatus Thermoplasmatota archaeon]